MLWRMLLVSFLCCGFFAASLSNAQTINAHRIPNAEFIRLEFIKFKPGGEDRAFELEDRYITPAWKASGLTPPLELHLQTGPWDRIYIYDLKCGLSEVEWQVSPERATLMAALAKIYRVSSGIYRKITNIIVIVAFAICSRMCCYKHSLRGT